MYKLVTVKDTVRVPPAMFGKDVKESVIEVLRQKYENKIDHDAGVILAISKIRDVGPGRIIPGDGAAYHDLTFEALAFSPKLHEAFTGKVSEIAQFGAFVRMGPMDGLVHVSQVTDDFISYNEKTGTLSGKESGKALKDGDIVRAKVVTLSMKPILTESKIGLTMRQPALGKLEWIEEAKRPTDKRKKGKGKKGEEPAAEEKKESKKGE